jgi:UDP-N-acetylglucosamine--N-acetylmuramyl-(pentapeptide) pyrophosphoryl-undecaprenol N-acetylglucosamine transferase
MPDALAAADLVLSRAGASSLAEITAVGRPAILMPYPYHRDRHQDANAAVLAGRGAAIVVADTRNCQETAASLRREMLHLLRDRPVLTRMEEAARSLGRPDAARIIAAELVGLSRGMLTPNAAAG